MYRLIRWAFAIGLTVVIVHRLRVWIPTGAQAGIDKVSNAYFSFYLHLVVDYWHVSDDGLINVIAGFFHVVAILVWLALQLCLAGICLVSLVVLIPAALYEAAYDWLVVNSPIVAAVNASWGPFIRAVPLALVLYLLTYLVFPENTRTRIDAVLIRVTVILISVTALVAALRFVTGLGLVSTLGVAVCVGAPIAWLLERIRERTLKFGWVPWLCVWLLQCAIIVILERYAGAAIGRLGQ